MISLYSGKAKQFLFYLTPLTISIGNPRWAGAVIILLSFFWIMEGGHAEKFNGWKSNYPLVGFILFFSLYPVSLLYTEHFDNGLFNIEKHLSYLFVPLVVLTSTTSKQAISWALGIFSYSLVFLLVFCFLVALHGFYVTGETQVLINEIVVSRFQYYGLASAMPGWHPTYVAMYANFALAYLFLKTLNHWNEIGPSIKFINIGSIIVIIVSVLFLSSFMGIMVLIITVIFCAFYALVKFRRKRAIILSIVLISGVAIGVFALDNRISDSIKDLLNDKMEATDEQSERNTLTIRLAKWSTSIDIIKSNIIFGVGPGDAPFELYEMYKIRGHDYLAEHKYNPHNQYLEILLSFGLIGFMIFIFLYGNFLKLALKGKNVLLLILLIIIGLTGFTESILERQQGVLFFSFFMPLLSHYKK